MCALDPSPSRKHWAFQHEILVPQCGLQYTFACAKAQYTIHGPQKIRNMLVFPKRYGAIEKISEIMVD